MNIIRRGEGIGERVYWKAKASSSLGSCFFPLVIGDLLLYVANMGEMNCFAGLVLSKSENRCSLALMLLCFLFVGFTVCHILSHLFIHSSLWNGIFRFNPIVGDDR